MKYFVFNRDKWFREFPRTERPEHQYYEKAILLREYENNQFPMAEVMFTQTGEVSAGHFKNDLRKYNLRNKIRKLFGKVPH